MAETDQELEEMKKNRKTPVRHSYDNWYRATLAAIGDAQVSALMVTYVPDLRFGVAARAKRGEQPNRTDSKNNALLRRHDLMPPPLPLDRASRA